VDFSNSPKQKVRMKTIERAFDFLGKAITSLAAVIFVLLSIITGMVLFSHTLFVSVFPANMTQWEKMVATWTMALGWEATVLLTTVNTKHVNKKIPGLMAICSGCIVLFFIQGFDDTQPWLILVQRWFVGILAAGINFIYADLFFAKWKERNDLQEMPSKLTQLQTEVDQLNISVIRNEKQLKEKDAALKEATTELIDLRNYRKKIQSELTCPHCKLVQDNFGTLHAHKGHCASNPKRKLAIH
jgi:peptidoglycan hydrolase CwlO-like protein